MSRSSILAAVLAGGLVLGLLAGSGCAPAPRPASTPTAPAPLPEATLHETPPPAQGWRGHRLARCPQETDPPAAVRKELDLAWDLFHEGSGSDGMVELETTMGRTRRHPLVLLTLAQLYVMAGQGVPELLPTEGPAADTGDWDRNRTRLLARARRLLDEVGRVRPDDAAVDYLLADAARAGGDFAAADSLVRRAAGKCTGGAGFEIMRRYQQLNLYPAELPADAAARVPAGVPWKRASRARWCSTCCWTLRAGAAGGDGLHPGARPGRGGGRGLPGVAFRPGTGGEIPRVVLAPGGHQFPVGGRLNNHGLI